MTRRILFTAPLGLVLAGCVQAQTTAFYGTFEVTPSRASFCENYARQTYDNTYQDLYDPRDGFGGRSFAQNRAQRAADRAYDRCVAGRTN